jgi:hypothetical protein
MTEAQARTTADVVLATAVIGAAYYIVSTPPLRRKVWQMARSWAAGPLMAWTATEIRRAWDSSGPALAAPQGRQTTARQALAAPYGRQAAAREALAPPQHDFVGPGEAGVIIR